MFLTKEMFLLFLLVFLSIKPFAQECRLIGVIIDDLTGHPIPYANAIITSAKDSTVFLGAITDDDGQFIIEKIKQGKYQLTLSFIGYQSVIMENLLLQRGTRDIGEVKMNILAENLEAVTIKATTTPISYKVDKKVIDAGSFPGASMAMDLLENVPSLQVDINGELTYRGDGTFKVFVNGHPVANGIEKLKQIPANKIKRIEVITNPSAKYDAEGTAGIINVILKRNRLPGYAINASSSVTTLGSFDFLFSIEKQYEKGGWYVNGDFSNYIGRKRSYMQNQNTISEGILYETKSDIKEVLGGKYNSIELGFNYDLSDKDYLDFSAYINPMKNTNENSANGDINEYTELQANDENNYKYNSQLDLSYRYFGFTTSYKHSFSDEKTNKLSTYIDFATYLHPLDEKQVVTRDYGSIVQKEGYIGKEYNEILLNANMGYENQISDNSSLETGAKVELDHIPKVTSVSGIFDENDNITPFPGKSLNQSVDFKQDVYAAYLIFKSSFGKFEYQLGLRSEFTDRKSNYEYDETDDIRKVIPAENRFWDWFPSLHTVYSFSETHQLAANFTRRIKRPDYWKLVPLSQYDSPYSYYKGNGNLMPSYANAFEVAYKKSWDKNFIGIEIFARNTQGLIQNYSRVDTANILVITPENVGDSWSIGTEFMTGIDVFHWWNVNFSTSLFTYQLHVDIDNLDKTEKQFRSDSRLNNTFLLPKAFTLKWDFIYRSPSITAQTKQDDYYYSNIAIKKGFKDNTWVLTLSYANIFNSKKYSVINNGDDFRINTDYMEKPFARFKIAYIFNNQE
jgi:outer membrane receptor protein involved in Fe transport